MRRNRKLEFGASYYLTCNINRFKEELKEDDIKELFVTTLKGRRRSSNSDVYDIIILNDHFHMVLNPTQRQRYPSFIQNNAVDIECFCHKFNKRQD